MASHVIDWDDTIVALATPPGMGAIGVIRVSGKQTFSILNDLFPSKNLLEQASHTLVVGLLKDQSKVLDEVVLSLFKGPKSYTGEDVIEISCHGSAYIQSQIIASITARGARLAKAGEFTQRAFLNGKLDLAQAESVADLIASNSEASKRAAIHTMRGGFSNDLAYLREQLIKFSALIELELDFAEEDVEFANRSALHSTVNELQQATQQLINSFALGNVIKNGVQVAIIGKPNAGKSTLLNALLNENRAIVSDIAGTTRDTIEEVLNIEGVLFRLIDTAGIRTQTDDVIEQLGVAKSLEKMNAADLVVYLFDAATTSIQDIEVVAKELTTTGIKHVLVANKIDSITPEKLAVLEATDSIVCIAAKNKLAIDTLKNALVQKAVGGDVQTESTVVTNARHQDALLKLQASLQDVSAGLSAKITGDLLALDIRQCLHYLGLITGEITNDDQLDYIFSKFCIGK
ncbi:MAG: tRNA uridine-5-carboxymethylaminomethyl(34) synthesis GTPase MnmE [Bacteroidetes bacterium]|nr:tRNA uridine-5-carboxymethylaminomethyl(34) synthesis GTPase MnmE [Bacteroidota bacterium]